MFAASRSCRPAQIRRPALARPQARSYSGGHHHTKKHPTTVSEVIAYGKAAATEIVDFRFVDLHGTEHHIQFPWTQIEECFEKGVPFDGSSIRGWQPINESDMLLVPDPKTARVDPFTQHKTLMVQGNIFDPISKKPYSRDPRGVAARSIDYLRSTGTAHDCFVGPEQEFFVFDKVSYANTSLGSHYKVEAGEASTGSGEPHSGHYKIRRKEGYFPVKPHDQHQDMRSEMVLVADQLGLECERSHHEVAASGQGEINYKYGDLVAAADKVTLFKYIVRNVSAKYGRIATFMPKPIADENGTGMHCHFSLHEPNGKNLFTGTGTAGLSDMALFFVGGLVKHSKALLAFTNPTVNSYRRLVPGFEAPINMAYSARNRSASIRIPVSHPKARRLEFRTPDGSCNPYLAFPAILMAGLDGIQNRIHPGPPLDKDIYSLTPEELAAVPKAPADLADALDHLEKDHEWLLRGGVFTPDLIEMWISRKREFEVDVSRKLPTPWEFHQYIDC